MCVVNFLFSTFLGLLRRSLQKKSVSQSENRKEGWVVGGWCLVVGDRAGNRQQITDSLGNPLGREGCEADNILDA